MRIQLTVIVTVTLINSWIKLFDSYTRSLWLELCHRFSVLLAILFRLMTIIIVTLFDSYGQQLQLCSLFPSVKQLFNCYYTWLWLRFLI